MLGDGFASAGNGNGIDFTLSTITPLRSFKGPLALTGGLILAANKIRKGIDMKAHSKRLGIDVAYNAICIMKDTKDDSGWRHDAWSIEINGVKIRYRTGLGLRKGTKPIEPGIDDVLNSLCSDMSLGMDTFDEFCATLGCDTDSRKQLESYLECQRTGQKLANMKLGKTIAEIQEAFIDY